MQNGWTALIWATLRDHVAVATLLLDRGADIEAKDSGGQTALTIASLGGPSDVAKLLVERGAKPPTST
ncbi:hypothetical protein FNF27_06274 [Cafeteria roenbergensis]|uniref:Uncharacterized protein n=1 Tax=Cafeteria roenbergensis TaxID=33653 RepID=A0A5A8CYP6_CAFRO|nr:hypothetical protein FNF29_07261 [Cafeteria roenbergensis]KAA0158282.1 hypothetical protein FNF28_06315 [Cafeteria roenbergensis]KAA0167104.1 hypothetical protein FNF31_00990 [Cafeteria roenbergensis]KAA0171564.1 hypothetical protein FNF27_06274 [Cafeteria roenbergensis]|eukprot:KAA0147614.1 hypothetical protein FNF29_07261 [Cafeteria roenbergensis]